MRAILFTLTSFSMAANLRHQSLPFDCYADKGAAYEGFKDFTTSGRECMNWIDQGKESPTAAGIGNHNFCRNPGGKKARPWCYPADSPQDWEFCEVPKCDKDAVDPKPFKAPPGAKSKQ